MSGVKPWQIGLIVSTQIVVGCVLGCVAGYLGYIGVVRLVNNWLAASDVIRRAGEIIGLDVPTFLSDLSVAEIAIVWAAMTYLSVSVAQIILRLQGISSAKAPIDLIKS